ncbi:MAG: nucleotidyltransferase domain-containing protein [Candidatus Jordarchaeales archaeon]
MSTSPRERRKTPSFVAEESSNSVKVFWLDQDRLIESIRKIAVKVGMENENVVKIILFGSLAERRAAPGSDADILVVLEKDDKKFMDRIEEWTKKFKVGFPIEVFPYTLRELEASIAKEAMNRGIILYKKSEA